MSRVFRLAILVLAIIACQKTFAQTAEKSIRVETDVLAVTIGAEGGDVRKIELLTHRPNAGSSGYFTLLESNSRHVRITQTGLFDSSAKELPNHLTQYILPKESLSLQPGASELIVTLTADSAGVGVSKTYVFHRGRYDVDLYYKIKNKSSKLINPTAYFRLIDDAHKPSDEPTIGTPYFGMAVYTEKNGYEKVPFSDIANSKASFTKVANSGWVGLVQHYFVSAWIVATDSGKVGAGDVSPGADVDVRDQGGAYAAELVKHVGALGINQEASVHMHLFAGPQDLNVFKALGKAGEGLDATRNSGYLRFVSEPMFMLLRWMHEITGNWGWAIVLLTFAIKAATTPLAYSSFASGEKIKVVAPEMTELEKKYAGDDDKLRKEIKALYAREGVAPFRGIISATIQSVIFIGLLSCLQSAVELRHAEWILWVDDLSQVDKMRILPSVLMAMAIGGSYIKRRNEAFDLTDFVIAYGLPVSLCLLFYWLPVGLTLYFFSRNAMSLFDSRIFTWYSHKANHPSLAD